MNQLAAPKQRTHPQKDKIIEVQLPRDMRLAVPNAPGPLHLLAQLTRGLGGNTQPLSINTRLGLQPGADRIHGHGIDDGSGSPIIGHQILGASLRRGPLKRLNGGSNTPRPIMRQSPPMRPGIPRHRSNPRHPAGASPSRIERRARTARNAAPRLTASPSRTQQQAHKPHPAYEAPAPTTEWSCEVSADILERQRPPGHGISLAARNGQQRLLPGTLAAAHELFSQKSK